VDRTWNNAGSTGVFENDERWSLVLRVAASRQFTKAPQLHDILLYICQRGLTDPGATIKEYEIGCHALGRKPDFNPNEDNIVRVQISHLRKKLDEYFSTAGKDEPLQITVPKGAYIPRFELRPEIAAATASPFGPPAAALEEAPSSKRPRSVWVPLLSVSTCLLSIFCLYLAVPAFHRANPLAATPAMRQDPFWSRFFGTSQPAAVVVADSNLVVIQDILHSDIPLADYLGRQYPEALLHRVRDPELRSALQLIAGRQYTSLADLTIASRLVDLSSEFSPIHAPIRYTRHMNIRDFKSGNFVLIGSRRAIPWVQLFDSMLSYSVEEDLTTHRFHFHNKRPRPGEPADYVPVESEGTAEGYAEIAVLPNLGNKGSVLILSGIAMESSEAAGELVVSRDFSQQLARLIGMQAVRDRYFEILLKTRSVAGAARSSQIVAYRLIQPVGMGS
jgi:hypothetical protein